MSDDRRATTSIPASSPSTGPDASSFLQSLLSQDLDPIAVGAGAPALLLQPQGKLIATLYALHVGDDDWWCITDAGGGAARWPKG